MEGNTLHCREMGYLSESRHKNGDEIIKIFSIFTLKGTYIVFAGKNEHNEN